MGQLLPHGSAVLLLFAQPQHALGAEHCGVAGGDKRPVQPAARGDVRAAARRVRCAGLEHSQENEGCRQEAPKAKALAGVGGDGLLRLLRWLGARFARLSLCGPELNGRKSPTQTSWRLPRPCLSAWAHRPLGNSLLDVLWGATGLVMGLSNLEFRGEPLPLRKNGWRRR